MKNWADWAIRAAKTFVQAFLGVLIPAFCAILSTGWPDSLSKLWVLLIPTIPAALAAAISAVWNIILEYTKQQATPEWEPTDTIKEWEPTDTIKDE